MSKWCDTDFQGCIVFRLLMALLLVTVAGCANKAPQPLMTFGDPAVESLNESAMRVARAAEQAALARSTHAPTLQPETNVTREFKIDLTLLPTELRNPLLLEGGFNGELEVFLKSLTAAIGWQQPIIFGSRPAVPLLVTLTEQRRPPIYWFADAGYQIGTAAEVIVNAELRQVVVTYPGGRP